MNQIALTDLLKEVQEKISREYSSAINKNNKADLRAYIQKYIRENNYSIEGMSFDDTVNYIFSEMAEFSILTPYLEGAKCNDIEEININAWDDIAITYTNGVIEKLSGHFRDPNHAVDTIKRLLQLSNSTIDNTSPMAQGQLPGNKRITVIKSPVVDDDTGISASIRFLHPQRITRDMLLDTQSATDEMLNFLSMCIRYGVSVVISGATSTGKTTLMNCLIGEMPDEKRIVTIESGARELHLVKKANGKTVNNVVHTLSHKDDNDKFNISQDDLVAISLRFNPDIIVLGEMRDIEAHSAVEASLTGHTVVSTVHSTAGTYAHTRISLLCQKAFPIDFKTSLQQTGMAFPIVVFTHKLEDNSRKIMDITECEITQDGKRIYRTLYRYKVMKNTLVNHKYVIEGCFLKENVMSDSLKNRLLQNGIPQDVLQEFLKIK